jgi:hypothetical protein
MPSTKRSPISSKRWAAYAAAGSAVAAASGSADAAVSLVSPNQNIVDGTPGDGIDDVNTFPLVGSASIALAFRDNGAGAGILTTPANGAGLNIVGGPAGAYFYPANLAYGDALNGAGTFPDTGRGDMAWNGGYANSEFVNTGGYFGFQFDVGAGTQVGWAQLELISGAPVNTFRLTQYAFAGPGESLNAGQIPEPSSMAFLALGAAGIATWRRRRS